MSLLVLSTAYVTPPGEAPYREIIAATDRDRGAPRLFCWTRDAAVYQRAAAVEGTAARVALDTARGVPSRGVFLPNPRAWREIVGLECL